MGKGLLCVLMMTLLLAGCAGMGTGNEADEAAVRLRGEYLKYRDRDFVHAARLAGVAPLRILFVHILPNTWPTLLSGLTIGFNNAVLSEASMSFLGIGVGPADASLGRMLSEGQGCLFSAPWCTLFPALVVILLVLGVGMLGEGIREKVR